MSYAPVVAVSARVRAPRASSPAQLPSTYGCDLVSGHMDGYLMRSVPEDIESHFFHETYDEAMECSWSRHPMKAFLDRIQ